MQKHLFVGKLRIENASRVKSFEVRHTKECEEAAILGSAGSEDFG